MIAYLILVHRYPDQFQKLFHAIYSPKNHYLIHIDKKAAPELSRQLRQFLAPFANAHILKSRNVVWGGYSMVDVELQGIKTLLKMSTDWQFFINLSGQDFPLKSPVGIRNFLLKNIGNSFVKIIDQVKKRPNTLNRIFNFFQEAGNGFAGKPKKRAYLADTVPYIGGQWKVLSRECCEFITSSPKVAKFRAFYRHTLIPDESFFQTVLMNTNFPGKVINDDKRAIIWVPDMMQSLRSKKFTSNTTKSLIDSGQIKLRPKTFTVKDVDFLFASPALFARKFDETVDAGILDLLESKLQAPLPSRQKSKQRSKSWGLSAPAISV
jgi:hypothetical protein